MVRPSTAVGRPATPYPHGYSDSGTESDPSEEFMGIESDSVDTSLQIVEPPPPEIIDLVSEEVVPTPPGTPVSAAAVEGEGSSSPFRSLSDMISVSTTTTAALHTPTLGTQASESGGDPFLAELLRGFQTTSSEMSAFSFPSMTPVTDRYRFDFSTSQFMTSVGEVPALSAGDFQPVYTFTDSRVQISDSGIATSGVYVLS